MNSSTTWVMLVLVASGCMQIRQGGGVMSQTGVHDEYGEIAQFYDHVVPYRDRQDVEFFVNAARESGGPVLEIGCGTGRVLVPTAEAGIDIVGIDLSRQMLHLCRERLNGESEAVRSRVRLIEADMRSFALAQTFRLVTLPFRPFQHLTTIADQRACLERIRRHLVPGGALVLDIFNPSLAALSADNLGEEIGEEPVFTLPDGRSVLRRHRIVSRDLFNQVNQCELIYYVTHPDGREERVVHAFPMRYLFRFEAEHLLELCGYELEVVYGDYDKSTYGTQYPGDLIMVARKTR